MFSTLEGFHYTVMCFILFICICFSKEIINTEGLKEWTLTFLRSPVELLSSTDGTVSSVKLEKNRIEVS